MHLVIQFFRGYNYYKIEFYRINRTFLFQSSEQLKRRHEKLC